MDWPGAVVLASLFVSLAGGVWAVMWAAVRINRDKNGKGKA